MANIKYATEEERIAARREKQREYQRMIRARKADERERERLASLVNQRGAYLSVYRALAGVA